MIKYTLGFAFDIARQNVVLITKQRPKWQAGQINGVGGHVEDDDKHLGSAMQREFWEETGVLISADKWQAYAALHGPGWYVRVFRTFTDDVFKARTMTDELVSLLPVDKVGQLPLLANLAYLIPLALDDDHIGVPLFNYGAR